MAKRVFWFLIPLLFLVSMGFVSAAQINSIKVNGTSSPDNFFSNYTGNKIMQVFINAEDAAAIGTITANFSNFTTSCGDNGAVTCSSQNAGINGGDYNCSCDVGNAAANSNFAGGAVIIVVTGATVPNAVIDTNATAILYNMSIPTMSTPCMRFGSSTTNFTKVLDFEHVNFIVETQINFSCMTNYMLNGTVPHEYNSAMLMNLTSVNLSTQDQAAKLATLQTAINVNITSPKSFGASRIFVDSTAFSALNTSGNITFYNLPFTTKPNVLADEGTAVPGSSVYWYFNGYSTANGVSTGNLTFGIDHFSGYNTTDNTNPLITIVSPNSNISTPVGSFTVRVNGTGTEPSNIIVGGFGTTYYYNSSGSNMQCSNISSDKETFECSQGAIGLSEGSTTITVNAWDYGGSNSNGPGNTNSSSFTFIKDTTGPTITVYNPANNTVYYINQSFLLYFSASDALTTVNRLWYNYNGTTNSSTSLTNPFSVNINYTVNGTRTIILYANDSLGNLGTTIVQINVTTLNSTSSYIVNDTSYNVTSNTTSIVVPFNSTIQTVTLTNTTQQVSFDLSQLMSNGIVAVGSNNFTLITQGTYNYTAIIPAGINITGATGWDGKINLPTINASSFTAPSGTANIIIDMGTSSEVNFSSPVKIIIGGMAGKSAAWSRGSTTLTAISTACTSATVPGITSGECYATSGSDLVIWTYHFTSFAAYTPTSTTPPDTGNVGGSLYGCPSDWTCSSWSSCTNGMQARTCTKNNPLCAATITKPSENQSCTVPPIPTGNETTPPETTPPTTTPPTTTPATAKQGLSTIMMIFIAAIVIVIIIIAATQLTKKKKK